MQCPYVAVGKKLFLTIISSLELAAIFESCFTNCRLYNDASKKILSSSFIVLSRNISCHLHGDDAYVSARNHMPKNMFFEQIEETFIKSNF